jgi:hypothetical protein
MRRLLAGSLVLLTMLAFAPGACAQTAKDSLSQLYELDLAVSACPGPDVATEDQARLDEAIQAAEEKSGLDDAARQSLYDDLETAAQADVAAFCARQTPGLPAAMKALPKS